MEISVGILAVSDLSAHLEAGQEAVAKSVAAVAQSPSAGVVDAWSWYGTNTRMATIFRNTMMLLVRADSLMPRTRITVSSMTMMKAGQLKPKCQPAP